MFLVIVCFRELNEAIITVMKSFGIDEFHDMIEVFKDEIFYRTLLADNDLSLLDIKKIEKVYSICKDHNLLL
jgi:hypothetical protein